MWNKYNRQVQENFEVGDICIITRKWCLDKLSNLSKNDLLSITNECKLSEHYWVKLLNYITNNQISQDENMHTAVLRKDHISHCS